LAYRLGRQALRDVTTIATPDTLLRWHRQLVARKWTFATTRSSRRGVLAEIRRLAVRMAEENPTWGYTRIQGALKNVGHRVGRSTIAYLEGARPPTGARAADVVADVCPVALGPECWGRFLHRRGLDLARPRDLLRDRPSLTPRADRRVDAVPRRGAHAASRSHPDGRGRRAAVQASCVDLRS